MTRRGVTLYTTPGYSGGGERSSRARERATWKRVSVRLPPDTFARLQALTERPPGFAHPSRETVLRYIITGGIDDLERENDAVLKRRARKGAR